MKTIIASFLLAIVWLTPASAQQACPQPQNFVCSPPTCADVTLATAPDPNTPNSNTVRIFLPDGYDPNDGTTRYPVLYLLHGAGDDFTRWSDNTDVFSFTRGKDLIVVMPNGGKNANAGWYSDWFDKSRFWETFHITELVPYVDAHYNTAADRRHRAIAGLSMGGFGAMHYAARHADLFGVAASFSGAVDMLYGFPLTGVIFGELHDMFGTPNDNVWGNQITEEANWEANNPASLAGKLANTTLFLATGDGVPGASTLSPLVGGPPSCEDPSNPAGYALEQGIFQMNVSFLVHLAAAGVSVPTSHIWFYPGGLHSWPYWQADLHWALPQILDAIGDLDERQLDD